MFATLRRILPIAVLLLVAAACEGNSTGSTPTDLTGTYALVSVNGSALPRALGAGLTIQTGTVQLDANGSWTSVIIYNDPSENNTNGGTFAANNTGLQFSTVGGENFGASVSGADLTIPGARLADDANYTLVFRKQ